MAQNLIYEIQRNFDVLDIKKSVKEKIMSYVIDLKEYHEPTFEHSFRVAEMGKKIAEFTHITEPKSLWLPGIVHDIGKRGISERLLEKVEGWNENDMDQMKRHVEIGCFLLSGTADFSAMVTFYSHHFKKQDGYPSEADFTRVFGTKYDKWSQASRTKGKFCGRLVSLADEYDAITKRKNDKFSPGKSKVLNIGEAKSLLVKNNPDQEYLIKQLYLAGIF